MTDVLELRAAAEVTRHGRRVEGYAAVFGVETTIGTEFRERIEPGAFAGHLHGVPLVFDHSTGNLLARSPSTMRLAEDTRGLHFDADLPDTQLGRDVTVLLERGDLAGASFRFAIRRDHWDDTGALPLRSIVEVSQLADVSLVTHPAYPDAAVSLRSRDASPEYRLHLATRDLRRRANAWASLIGPERKTNERTR